MHYMKYTTYNTQQKTKKQKLKSGFVALFAVLVASILLAMALGIANISYKEQLLSINTKYSQYSFTAADTGLECALYWDINLHIWDGNLSPNPQIAYPLNQCGDAQPDVAPPTIPTYKLPVTAMINATVVNGCAIFSVNKQYDQDGDGVPDSTKIDSHGYNLKCDDIDITDAGLSFIGGSGARAVERLLTVIYKNP